MALDGEGVNRWDVSEMTPGEPLSDQLRTAIRECQLCVFIATRHSIASQWCLAELGAFWGAGKTVMLFMVDPDIDESSLPPQFRGNLRVTSPRQLVDAIRAAEGRLAHSQVPLGFCRKIANRRELYLVCRDMINGSNVIRDTTWGRRADELAPAEKLAREEYRKAARDFIKAEKEYHEILTATRRPEHIADSHKLKLEFPKYQCRILTVDISSLSMLDMMICDNTRVVFSHVSAIEALEVQYVYSESETLAKLFLQFYSDAWRNSVDILTYIASKKNGGRKRR